MDVVWFLVLSALIFSLGLAGVLTRRNPLVILLCLELMLNGGNLALIAFSRMWGNEDGQVFALIVMVVAACEVVVGLGLIVAMYRRRVPIDVDELSELRGVSATDFGWLILLAPVCGMLVISLGRRVLPGRLPGVIASAAIGVSFAASIGAFLDLQDRPEEERVLTSTAWNYMSSLGMEAGLSILVDPLSVFMCLVVSGVSFLIHVYSTAYMWSDRGYARYFAYLNYFVFSMLLLVLAANFVLLIVGWAFVGAASYLLISFWYRRETATAAGMKAFVMNVIGDVGLVIGSFLLFDGTGALDYAGVFGKAAENFDVNDGQLVAACLMLLVGAFAKSAQLPLHTWLADAMEGPTPVSALIHAATMVTAGVYLIARMHPLFEQAPAAADVAAVIGTLTLLFAASVALVVTDLKRIIAYSTLSQIGYMIMGVSVFAYGAGLFHLMTHAFFKALLFMGAGSVIGAMAGNQNIDRMGGFRRAMPFTFVTFTIGALALAGFPFLSGFFSKDEIIGTAFDRGGLYSVLAVLASIAAGLTAFYAFRMVFRVFYGEPVPEALELERTGHLVHHEPTNPVTGEPEDTDVGFPGPDHHIAEQEAPMKVAMGTLALLSIVGGLIQIPGVTHGIESFLEPSFAESHHFHEGPSDSAEWIGLAIGGVIALVGIGTAYSLYMRRPGFTVALRDRYTRVHAFLFNKWYFDELYDRVFVQPTLAAGRFGRDVVERRVVQDVVIGWATGLVRSGFVREIQSGYVRAYALLFLMGMSSLGLYFLIVSG